MPVVSKECPGSVGTHSPEFRHLFPLPPAIQAPFPLVTVGFWMLPPDSLLLKYIFCTYPSFFKEKKPLALSYLHMPHNFFTFLVSTQLNS